MEIASISQRTLGNTGGSGDGDPTLAAIAQEVAQVGNLLEPAEDAGSFRFRVNEPMDVDVQQQTDVEKKTKKKKKKRKKKTANKTKEWMTQAAHNRQETERQAAKLKREAVRNQHRALITERASHYVQDGYSKEDATKQAAIDFAYDPQGLREWMIEHERRAEHLMKLMDAQRPWQEKLEAARQEALELTASYMDTSANAQGTNKRALPPQPQNVVDTSKRAFAVHTPRESLDEVLENLGQHVLPAPGRR